MKSAPTKLKPMLGHGGDIIGYYPEKREWVSKQEIIDFISLYFAGHEKDYSKISDDLQDKIKNL